MHRVSDAVVVLLIVGVDGVLLWVVGVGRLVSGQW